MENLSKSEAVAAGRKRYFTGAPCVHGHVSERFVSNNRCVDCNNIKLAEWRKRNVAAQTASKNKWNADNRERLREIKKAWYLANPSAKDKQKQRSRRWYASNKEKSFEAHRQWAERNPHMTNAAAARRRAAVLQRKVAWADHAKIKSIYRDAQLLTEMTGVEHHVDHGIPLQGDFVSGLHVEHNLQILPGFLNQSKGARFDASALWSN